MYGLAAGWPAGTLRMNKLILSTRVHSLKVLQRVLAPRSSKGLLRGGYGSLPGSLEAVLIFPRNL